MFTPVSEDRGEPFPLLRLLGPDVLKICPAATRLLIARAFFSSQFLRVAIGHFLVDLSAELHLLSSVPQPKPLLDHSIASWGVKMAGKGLQHVESSRVRFMQTSTLINDSAYRPTGIQDSVSGQRCLKATLIPGLH